MNSDRFFFEVDLEDHELQAVNGDLQILADQDRQYEIDAAYSAFMQDMMDQLYADFSLQDDYDDVYVPSEWDNL